MRFSAHADHPEVSFNLPVHQFTKNTLKNFAASRRKYHNIYMFLPLYGAVRRSRFFCIFCYFLGSFPFIWRANWIHFRFNNNRSKISCKSRTYHALPNMISIYKKCNLPTNQPLIRLKGFSIYPGGWVLISQLRSSSQLRRLLSVFRKLATQIMILQSKNFNLTSLWFTISRPQIYKQGVSVNWKSMHWQIEKPRLFGKLKIHVGLVNWKILLYLGKLKFSLAW